MMVRRRGKREQRDPSQYRNDAGGFPDVGSDMIGRHGLQGQCGESEVGERGVCVLGVLFQAIEGRVRGVGRMLLARGDETEKAGGSQGGVGIALQDRREEDGDWLFHGREGECRGDGGAPELIAHAKDGRGGRGVRDASEFEIEGADGEMSRTKGRWQKCSENICGMIILSASLRCQFFSLLDMIVEQRRTEGGWCNIGLLSGPLLRTRRTL